MARNGTPNTKRLLALRKKDELAAHLFDYLRARQMDESFVEASGLARQLGASRREVDALLKLLDRYHAGRFVVGRRGHPTRLEFAEGYPAALPGGPAMEGELTEDDLLSPPEPQRMLELPVILSTDEVARVVFPHPANRRDLELVRHAIKRYIDCYL